MAIDFFDSKFYADANPDLAAANVITPDKLKEHFYQSGLNEGRLFSPFVNLNLYASSNPDLVPANGINNRSDLYNHLQNHGIAENRKFSYFYDYDFYRVNNNDLNSLSNEDLINHLINNGISENRRFSPFVDLAFFKAANPDLVTLNQTDLYKKMVFNTMDIQNGFNNAKRLTVSYDPLYYLSKNPDLAASIGTTFQLFEHFYTYGLKENRTSSDSYNSDIYLNQNPDLLQNGMTTYELGLEHFEKFYTLENRITTNYEFPNPIIAPPGDNPQTAFNLGLISSKRNGEISYSLSSENTKDVYHFTLAQINEIDFTINRINSNNFFEVFLYSENNGNSQFDYSETVLKETIRTTSSVSLNKTLGAGTYYLAISPYLPNQPDLGYTIKISNVEKVATNYPVSINETKENAINIGTLSVNNQINITDYVGNVDQQDYYSFSLACENPVRLTISDVTNEQGINVSIYEKANPSPTLLNGSSSSSSPITLTSRKSLEARKIYYLSVSPSFSSSNSKYTLNLKFE